MKKQLLIALSFIPTCVFAQQNTPVVNPEIDVPHLKSSAYIASDQATDPFKAGAKYNPKLYKHPGYAGILIGRTFYDLQTNASVGRRVLLHPNGSVSAVWTTSTIGEANWPTRGTGYNHKASSSFLSPVNARLETQRTGWPGIGVLDNAGTKYEMVMGHVSTSGGWILSKNSAIGSTSFGTQTHILTQLNNKVAIWGRVGTNNDKIIHMVCNYYASTTDGVPVVKINGVSSPTVYCRSVDAGLNWDKKFETMPGYDSTRVVAGGGDNYAIDVKDSIVAIVIGGLGEDVALYKSTNNGNTFTRMVVEAFPFSPFVKKYIPTANRQATADGSFDVIIGNDDKVHVFFGRSFVADEDTSDETYSFYPGTAQLMHWAEGWDSVNVCGLAKDYDGNGTLDITAETTNFPNADGSLPNGVNSATRYGANSSLVSFPSSSIDANGNLYVIYTAPHEGAISPFNANYRDVYVSYSRNGGVSWTIGQNITSNALGVLENKENVFASAAKRADSFLHLIYQEDDLPGTNLQNNGTSNTHPNDEQKIMYRAVPVADILGGQVGDPVSVKRIANDPKIFFVSQNQPNPVGSETQAFIYMRDGSEITLTVSDITGKLMSKENLGYHSAGNHAVTINANGLSSGLYLYTISNNKYSVTKKMQVK